jgi:hypothetical protein
VTESAASRGRFAWIQRLVARWRGESVPPSLSLAAEDAAIEAESLEPAAPLDLAGLEKQVAKLGREQFKLNALLEKQQAQIQVALDQLREQDARREQERVELTARTFAARAGWIGRGDCFRRAIVGARAVAALDSSNGSARK